MCVTEKHLSPGGFTTLKELSNRLLFHWLRARRQKASTPVDVPLLDVPLQILAKYEDCCPNGKLLPMPSNQKCNVYLKEIAAICGIEKRLTFHLARHTFATTVTYANGVPIELVSKMLGHRSLCTTQIYAKIVNDKLAEDMAKLSTILQHLAM